MLYKLDKFLANLIKMKIITTEIRNHKMKANSKTKEIKKNLRLSFQKWIRKSDWISQLSGKNDLPKCTQQEIDNLN